ncbi:MAG: hypothetical protein H6613_19910 [Ignavibacteriales bacterium]|nr:hypothetical protein [Ignavibacteriales bacterium]
MEVSGLDTTLTIAAGTIYDMAVVDSAILLIHDGGSVTPIVYANGTYISLPVVTDAVPSGSWKSSSVVDIDDDGTKEIIVNGYGSSSPKNILASI